MDTASTTLLHILDAAQKPQGPFTPAQLREMIKTGRARPTTLAAIVGDEEWLPLSTFDDLIREPRRTVVSAPVASASRASVSGITKAGVILLAIGGGLALLFGMGMIEMILVASGLVLLVVGLCRKG